MGEEKAPEGDAAEERTGVVALAAAAVLAGAWAGLVVALFRLALRLADRWRGRLVAASHALPGPLGLLLVAGGACACVSAAAWLVRRYSPLASGSASPRSKRRFAARCGSCRWRASSW